MGVKSTRELTRAEAEKKYVDLVLSLSMDRLIRQARSDVALLDNKTLENTLEQLNDEDSDGEGFENYLVVS